jgi:hypothetical protein
MEGLVIAAGVLAGTVLALLVSLLTIKSILLITIVGSLAVGLLCIQLIKRDDLLGSLSASDRSFTSLYGLIKSNDTSQHHKWKIKILISCVAILLFISGLWLGALVVGYLLGGAK